MVPIIIVVLLIVVIIALCFVQFKTGGTPENGQITFYDPDYAEIQRRKITSRDIVEKPPTEFIKTKIENRPLQHSLIGFKQPQELIVSFIDKFRKNQVSVQVIDGQLMINFNNNLYMPAEKTQQIDSAELVSGDSDSDIKTTSNGIVSNYKFIFDGNSYYLSNGNNLKTPLKKINIDVVNSGSNATFKYGDYMYTIKGVNSYSKSMSYSNINGVEERSSSSTIEVNNDPVIIIDYQNKPRLYNISTKKIEETPTFIESTDEQVD